MGDDPPGPSGGHYEISHVYAKGADTSEVYSPTTNYHLKSGYADAGLNGMTRTIAVCGQSRRRHDLPNRRPIGCERHRRILDLRAARRKNHPVRQVNSGHGRPFSRRHADGSG